MSQRMFRCVLALLGTWPMAASAQETFTTLGELQSRSPTVLTRVELLALLPGAAMARVNDKGSTHHWTNEPGGEMVVSSDNRGRSGHASTARAAWRVSEDGRYCLKVEWKRGEVEDSCRLIVKAGDEHYAVDELAPPTRKAQRLDIRR